VLKIYNIVQNPLLARAEIAVGIKRRDPGAICV